MDLNLSVKTKSKLESSLELDDEVVEPVSPTSQYFLSEVVTIYVLAYMELAIPVDFPSILAFLNEDFVNVHPRFSSIVIEGKKGRKMWKKVEVNVQDHIKVPNFPEELSAESYSEYFDDYVSSIATSQLPQHKPLWELHIINNPKHINAAGLFLFKVHHAIGDGTSFMVGILSCFKRVDDPSLPVTYPLKTRSTATRNLGKEKKTIMMVNMFKVIPKILYSSVYSLYDFGQGVGSIFIKDDKSPIRSGKIDTRLSSSTRVCSVNLSLNDVKRIKTLLEVTVNDIIVGIIFLGTQLYIKEKDPKHYGKNRRSRASIFVNLRNMKGNLSLKEMREGKTWGNRIASIEVQLPTLKEDDLTKPLQFIKKAHKTIKRKTNVSFGLYLMNSLLKVVRTFGGLQAAARTFERKWKNCSFAITNMIGPTEQVSFANHPVNGFYFVPTGVDLSLVVSVLSYMENLRLGFVVENGFIDHQRLVACVEKAFQLIYEAATL